MAKFISFVLATLPLIQAKDIGYFDSADCVDPSGFESCYNDADSFYSSCVSSNCAGGSQACYNSCGGSVSCMQKQCPGLGIDCINACGCAKTAHEIDCVGASCWNQVYSCEYQKTAEDLLNLCANPDPNQIPFWPPPDDAPASCSCNFAKIDKTQLAIVDQYTQCTNNVTNINNLSETDRLSDYTQACTCCAQSAVMSTIWDTCPNTNPSAVGADDWYNIFLATNHWDECGLYLKNYDCAGTLGYGSAAGAGANYYAPGQFPTNGTASLSDLGGTVPAPVSGNTFTWTLGTVAHPVTAVAATATAAGGGTSTTTGSGGTATSTNDSGRLRVSLGLLCVGLLIAYR